MALNLKLLISMLLLSLLATTAPLAEHSHSFPNPEPMTGNITGHIHDPSIIRRADGTYFLFATNNKIGTFSAPSLSGPWTFRGPALPSGSRIAQPGSNDLWAPDVFQLNDTYHLYYSVSTWGAQATSEIGVATSTTLEPGSWTDHGAIGIPPNARYNRIDPNLFRETASSQFLLSFGSFQEGIFQLPMSNPPLKVLPPTASDRSLAHLQRNKTRPNTEGPYLFWTPSPTSPTQKWFYLFFSSGACCNAPDALAPAGEEYRINVCRSSSPSGPFLDKQGVDCADGDGGSLLLASHGDVYAPGGQGVFFGEGTGRVVVYYHYVRRGPVFEYERFFWGWNILEFEGEGGLTGCCRGVMGDGGGVAVVVGGEGGCCERS